MTNTTRTAPAAHTPGPWRIGTAYGADEENLPILDEAGNLVALADCSDKCNHADKVDADARLIAAAPDLLAALKAFMRAPSTGSDGPGSLTIVVQEFNLREARDAIARAEGRQP